MQNATSTFLMGVNGTEAAPEAPMSLPPAQPEVEAAVLSAAKQEDVNDIAALAERTGLAEDVVGAVAVQLEKEGFLDRSAGINLTEAGNRLEQIRGITK